MVTWIIPSSTLGTREWFHNSHSQLHGEGDRSDGDISEGDSSDGDISEGDSSDGDISEGDSSDGDISEGDSSDSPYLSTMSTLLVSIGHVRNSL